MAGGKILLLLMHEQMDELRNFGSGPRELTGAVDLINHFKLLSHHDFFCKRPLPVPVSETHYLHNVVGDTEIRKGEGMQLDQLLQNTSLLRETNARILPFDLDTLREAFQLKEVASVDLPSVEKGIPTFPRKKGSSKDKDGEKKHRKHKDKDRDKEHKKHKHRHKDRSKDKDRDRDKKKEGYDSKKNQDKRRKHDGDEDPNDLDKLKKSKHKTSKMDEMGSIRVAG